MDQNFKERIDNLSQRIEKNRKDTLEAQEEVRQVFAEWSRAIKSGIEQTNQKLFGVQSVWDGPTAP